MERDALAAAVNPPYVNNLIATLGTPGAQTITIGDFTHRVRWLVMYSDVYEEQGHGAEYNSYIGYLDLPTSKFASVTLDVTCNDVTLRAVFTRVNASNAAAGYKTDTVFLPEIYNNLGPVTFKVVSSTLA